MFTVHLGLQKTVVLAGYEAVREALLDTGQQLADRPPIPIFHLIQQGGGRALRGSGGGGRWRSRGGRGGAGRRGRPSPAGRPAGIFFSSGARWRAARQFTVRALHSLGVGRGPVAGKVLQELACLTQELDGYRGEQGPGCPSLCPPPA